METGQPAQDEAVERRCFYIVDYSEPCIWFFGIIGFVGLVVGLVPPHAFAITIASVLILLACISGWRVRSLGTAYALMESVDDLRAENTRLAMNIDELDATRTRMTRQIDVLETTNGLLGEQIDRFSASNTSLENMNKRLGATNEDLKGVVGLVGDKIGDVECATDKILDAYNKYKAENLRQEKNNLMSLFDVIDRDNDGILNPTEIKKLREYVKKAYGRDIADFDTNEDGTVTFKEFVNSVVV